MKIGQLLADGTDEDPLQELVDGIEPLDLSTVEECLKRSLSPEQRGKIGELLPAFHAASIGQVHRAKTVADSKELAVKIQYPDIERAIKNEMKLLGLMPKMGPVATYSFDLSSYKRILADNFERELDYLGEAVRQERFRATVRVDGLIVPEVYLDLCSKRVLVQAYLGGMKLNEAASLPKATRLKIGRTLLSTLLHGIFRSGLIHGDPHSGNYRFTVHGEVILYDFGCVVEVPKERCLALLSFISCLRESRTFDPIERFASLGFDAEKLRFAAPKLSHLARVLFAPFLSDGAFAPEDWALKSRFDEALGEQKWWFRSAGPPELFLLLRAFQGIVSLLANLDVRLPWWALARHLLSEDEFELARKYVPRQLSAAAGENCESSTMKTSGPSLLRVSVERSDGPMELSLPAEAALQLRELVPPGALDSASAKALSAAETSIKDFGLRAGILLDGHAGGQRFRVWLE